MIASLLLLALKSLLVAAVTLGLLRLNARRSAAERSTIAHLGLFALIALPLASLALPPLSIALPAPTQQALRHVVTRVAEPLPVTPVAAAPTEPAAASWSAIVAGLAEALAPYVYVLPAVALLLLTGIALLRLVSLRARAQVLVDPAWLAALARAQRRMGFKNGTALLTSDDLSSPISWGLIRPTILLNDEALGASDQAEAIIAHELAHVIQHDWAKLMLARVATAAFWFNPLAWVLAREAHQLREEAADDAVLAADIAGPDYAQLLVGIARHESRTFLLSAHGVAPSRNSLRRRIARVLDASPARGASGRSWVAGFTVGMLVMAAPLAAVTLGKPRPEALEVTPVQPKLQVQGVTFAPAHAVAAAANGHNVQVEPTPLAQAAKPAAPAATPVSAYGYVIQIPDISPIVEQYAGAAAATNVRSQLQAAQSQVRAATAQSMAIRAASVQATAQASAPRGSTPDVDQLIQMRAVGVTREYQNEMAQAGFPNLSVNQLVQARSIGLNGDYVREMRRLGLSGDFNTIVQARAVGLSTDYVRDMKAAGVQANISQYQGMRALGVSADFVRSLHARGLNVTAPEKLMQLKAVGYDPGGDDSP